MFRRIGSTSPIMRAAPCGSPTRSPPSPKSCTEALGGSWPQGCRAMVCEATGGYERPLMLAAAQLGLPLRRVHPNRARAFAKASARLAKTDAIDARMLARFAAFIADEPARPSPAPQTQALAALVSRLDQLSDLSSVRKLPRPSGRRGQRQSLDRGGDRGPRQPDRRHPARQRRPHRQRPPF